LEEKLKEYSKVEQQIKDLEGEILMCGRKIEEISRSRRSSRNKLQNDRNNLKKGKKSFLTPQSSAGSQNRYNRSSRDVSAVDSLERPRAAGKENMLVDDKKRGHRRAESRSSPGRAKSKRNFSRSARQSQRNISSRNKVGRPPNPFYRRQSNEALHNSHRSFRDQNE
jgi:hypothetical protein